MNDRLEIASRLLASFVARPDLEGDLLYARDWRAWREFALKQADELIKQEALTRVKKEAEEHK